MGTYANIAGDGFNTIPDEKKPEFLDRALTVLREGGICSEEVVSLFDKRFSLVKPVEPDENGRVVFDYSAYELDYWEYGSLDKEACEFKTNKIGWKSFSRSVRAVLVLAEQYANCLALENDLPFPITSTLGWLNFLFDTEFANAWTDMERAKLLVPEYKRDQVTPDSRDWTSTGAVPKLNTVDFFGIMEADRFYLWRPDDELSTEAQAWLTTWRDYLDSVVAAESWETKPADEAQRRMVDVLAGLPVPSFSEMFYSFFAAAGERRVQAMVRLLNMMRESWEKREVGWLVSALGSRELRKRFFDL